MSKDRNCMGNVNMPMYQPGIPVMPLAQTYPMNYQNSYNMENQAINAIQQKIMELEERVSKLEEKSTTSYPNKYNSSNYYML
jgi:hypothetical protein